VYTLVGSFPHIFWNGWVRFALNSKILIGKVGLA
jgi:hypothetical protein